MDLKNALKDKDSDKKKLNEKPVNENNEEFITKHKKPMQLRDIETRSSSNHRNLNEKY